MIAPSLPGGNLLGYRGNVQGGKSSFGIVVSENENASSLRIDRRMIRRRHPVFAAVTSSNYKRCKRSGVEKFADSCDHDSTVSEETKRLKNA